jgi:hypothetical protein
MNGRAVRRQKMSDNMRNIKNIEQITTQLGSQLYYAQYVRMFNCILIRSARHCVSRALKSRGITRNVA